MKWKLVWPPEPVCPFYKLCTKDTIQQVRQYIHQHRPDVAHFQEVWNPPDIKSENNQMKQLLPPNYKFACGKGAHDLYSVCTAWKSEFLLIGGHCQSVYRPHGGYLVCHLSRGDSEWQFVNVHGSALEPEDRKLLLEHLWQRFEKYEPSTIIGGDFNTSLLAEDELKKIPHSFKKLSGGFSTTVFGEAIDHIFVAHLKNSHSFSVTKERDWPYPRWRVSDGLGVSIDHDPLWMTFE